jgi:hypothetical protein
VGWWVGGVAGWVGWLGGWGIMGVDGKGRMDGPSFGRRFWNSPEVGR